MQLNKHNFPRSNLQLCRYIVIPGEDESRLYREIEESEYKHYKEYKEFEGSRWILLVEHKDTNYLYSFVDNLIAIAKQIREEELDKGI